MGRIFNSDVIRNNIELIWWITYGVVFFFLSIRWCMFLGMWKISWFVEIFSSKKKMRSANLAMEQDPVMLHRISHFYSRIKIISITYSTFRIPTLKYSHFKVTFHSPFLFLRFIISLFWVQNLVPLRMKRATRNSWPPPQWSWPLPYALPSNQFVSSIQSILELYVIIWLVARLVRITAAVAAGRSVGSLICCIN